MLFKALNAAFVQCRIQTQGNDDAHQRDAVGQRFGLQGIGIEPVGRNPGAGGNDEQATERRQRQKYQLERAQQPAQALFACRQALLLGHCANQAGRQPCIQQLQPGLQQGEEADQPVGLGTQMAQIKRHDQNPDQQHVCLPAVVQDGITNHRVSVLHDDQPTHAMASACWLASLRLQVSISVRITRA